MGRSNLQTTEEFVDDYNARYQQEMESRAEIRARFEKNNNNFNIAALQAEEEKKEKLYDREARDLEAKRQAGVAGNSGTGTNMPSEAVRHIAAAQDNGNNNSDDE